MRFVFIALCFFTLGFAQADEFLQGRLSQEVLDRFYPLILEELELDFSHQCDGRTHRDTREYGYSFFKMIGRDFSYDPPPDYLQELGREVCLQLGHEPRMFTNIIVSLYEEGFHLEPHVDMNPIDFPGFPFYFDDCVYGLVVESDPTGHLYFVYDESTLIPPLNLPVIDTLKETDGTVFCLQGKFRYAPYFHAVSNVTKRRISITFRTVKF